MTRIEQIRQRRERAFYKNRMKGNKERQIALDKKLVEDNPQLLKMREVEMRIKEEKAAKKAAKEAESDDEMDISEDEEMESEEEEELKQKIVLKNKRKTKVKF
ncbi:unnamed protein product [Ambrosiozyma monospora]|uniref:Unnamed protein product n=1 Tax=Ambrosiozyma monospora TaxID=43982 RepID=A0ACB5T7M8_AMBMO|nr:unnamed protein product [Ambrosiozyma monospora]